MEITDLITPDAVIANMRVTSKKQALQELAKKAARMPPKAVAATRRVLRQGVDLPLDAALALENREFLLLFDTADKTEGMRAFLGKRTPLFQHR